MITPFLIVDSQRPGAPLYRFDALPGWRARVRAARKRWPHSAAAYELVGTSEWPFEQLPPVEMIADLAELAARGIEREGAALDG